MIYEQTRALVLTPDGETSSFDIIAGVLQGDTLAPYLFIIVLDYVMRTAIGDDNNKLGFTITPRAGRRYPAEVVTDLDFADDIALLSDTPAEAQELLQRVEEQAQTVGLHMNSDKTKVMKYNENRDVPIRSLNGNNLERVTDFQYLGSWVDSSEKDIDIRKAKAWVACNRLNAIWTSKLPKKLKIRLFKATVESVLLYGAECWTLTKRLEQKLDGCYTRMLMRVQNMNWKQHHTLSEIHGNLPQITTTIQSR